MSVKSTDRKNLINWSRNCHFDFGICVKEVKGKRWMSVLSWLESKYCFDINELSHSEAWSEILSSINQLSEEEVRNGLYHKRQV
jgi:hypothetical protein